MSTLTNKTARDIVLPTGHVIARNGGKIETTNAVIRSVDNAPLIKALETTGALAIVMDADPEPGFRPAPPVLAVKPISKTALIEALEPSAKAEKAATPT